MTREEKAVYYKHNGFNCCQSVIKAMIDLSDSDKEILTNAASGFAVGMGGMEATCDPYHQPSVRYQRRCYFWVHFVWTIGIA